MKRIPSLAALALATASCINTVPLDFGEPTPQLVMNAQLEAGEGDQLVFLSESSLTTLAPLQGADVTILVDGKPFATAGEVPAGEAEYTLATGYRFQGGFPAGSQVKVSARKDGREAWAQADVMPPPILLTVDTLRTMEREFDEAYEVFQVKITLKDLPGSSYYRTGVQMSGALTLVDAAGQTREQTHVRELAMRSSNDPVLGGAATGMSLFNLDKTYLVFSDELFRDQEYTLRLSIDSRMLYAYDYRWEEDFFPVRVVSQVTLLPWLESISRDEFNYLNALNNLENFGYTAEVIVEPTTLPTNVNGGLGMVAVRNRALGNPIPLSPEAIDLYYYDPN